MFALSNHTANEALALLNNELLRSRTNMSVDTVWFYLKAIRLVEMNYKDDLNQVMTMSAISILLDKVKFRNEIKASRRTFF